MITITKLEFLLNILIEFLYDFLFEILYILDKKFFLIINIILLFNMIFN